MLVEMVKMMFRAIKVVAVALQPIHEYGDDAVDYEQRSDQEILLAGSIVSCD